MRILGWLVLGLLVCHESLVLFGRHESFNDILSNLIMSPVLFLKGSFLMLFGLCVTASSLRKGLMVIGFRKAHVRHQLIYGMIYSVILLIGWGWLVITTTILGGLVTMGLTLLLFFLWDKT